MTTQTIEEKLQNVDFSKNSKIQNMLLTKLLHRRKVHASLSIEDLDMVVAAGNSLPHKIDNANHTSK